MFCPSYAANYGEIFTSQKPDFMVRNWYQFGFIIRASKPLRSTSNEVIFEIDLKVLLPWFYRTVNEPLKWENLNKDINFRKLNNGDLCRSGQQSGAPKDR